MMTLIHPHPIDIHWHSFDGKCGPFWTAIERCLRIMNALFMEMNLFWRTTKSAIKFYGFLSQSVWSTQSFCIYSPSFCIVFSIFRVYLGTNHFISHPPILFHVRCSIWGVSTELMNDVPLFLLFTVWSVKLAMEMILMVLQWHSNTQSERERANEPCIRLVFCFSFIPSFSLTCCVPKCGNLFAICLVVCFYFSCHIPEHLYFIVVNEAHFLLTFHWSL